MGQITQYMVYNPPSYVFIHYCILGNGQPTVFLNGGYEGTTADYCIYLLVIFNIFKPQNCRYLQRIKVFSGPKNVVISSKKYDIHRLTLNLYILNKSQLDVKLRYWQGI